MIMNSRFANHGYVCNGWVCQCWLTSVHISDNAKKTEIIYRAEFHAVSFLLPVPVNVFLLLGGGRIVMHHTFLHAPFTPHLFI